ncbi:hypothetical protein ACP4OV_028563 [Aristida adscensionis]
MEDAIEALFGNKGSVGGGNADARGTGGSWPPVRLPWRTWRRRCSVTGTPVGMPICGDGEGQEDGAEAAAGMPMRRPWRTQGGRCSGTVTAETAVASHSWLGGTSSAGDAAVSHSVYLLS